MIRSFSSGGKRKSEWYRKLFLHYEAKESFEEANEKSELEAQGFPGHVAVLKNQLFNWILKEMHTYHHTVQKDNWTNLEGMYWKAMYLKKKLPHDGVKFLEEAKSLAIENGNTFWLLILLKDQISRAGLIHDKGTLDGPIDELEAEFYAGIEDARRTGSLLALISRLAILNRQRYGTGLLDRVNELKKSPVLLENPDTFPLPAQLLMHNIQGILHTLIFDLKEASAYFYRGIGVFISHPSYVQKNWFGYISVVSNYALLNSVNIPQDFFAEHLPRIARFIDQSKQKSGDETYILRARYSYLNIKSIYCAMYVEENGVEFDENDFQAVLADEIESSRPNVLEMILTIKTNLAIVYIRLHQLERAQNLVTKIMNDPMIRVAYHTNIFVLLLQMYLSYVKGDIAHIQYLQPKLTYQEKKIRDQIPEIVRLIPRQLIRLGSARNPIERKAIWEKCMEEFRGLDQKEAQIPTYAHFHWGQWLERIRAGME